MTGTRPAQQSISDLLAALSQRLDPLIAARLTGGTDNTDWTTIPAELDRAKGRSRHSYSRTDLQSQLRMLTERLGGFGFPFDDSLRQVSTVANELHILRNRWVHYDPLSDLDACAPPTTSPDCSPCSGMPTVPPRRRPDAPNSSPPTPQSTASQHPRRFPR